MTIVAKPSSRVNQDKNTYQESLPSSTSSPIVSISNSYADSVNHEASHGTSSETGVLGGRRMVRGVCGVHNIWCNPPTGNAGKMKIDIKSQSPRRDQTQFTSDRSAQQFCFDRKSVSPKRSAESPCSSKQVDASVGCVPLKFRTRRSDNGDHNPFGGGGLMDRFGNPISSRALPQPPHIAKKKLITRTSKSSSGSPGRRERIVPQLNLINIQPSGPILPTIVSEIPIVAASISTDTSTVVAGTPVSSPVITVPISIPATSSVARRDSNHYTADEPNTCSNQQGTLTVSSFSKLSSGSSSDSGGEGIREEKKKQLVLHLPPHGSSTSSSSQSQHHHHRHHHHGDSARERSHKR